jgi:tRNA threonylcarbamoyladenosine biosynthesis protein TsaB
LSEQLQLAIDTSTDTACLALLRNSSIVAELNWHAGRNHTAQALPSLQHLLGLADASLDQLDAIFVAKGPGSFTGLRVGLAIAKGLAFAFDIPLVGVSTLEAHAFAHARTGRPVCALQDAGRGEVSAAIFQAPRSRWRRLIQEHITTIEDLCKSIEHRTLFCGNIPNWAASELKRILRHRAVIIGGAAGLRRAGYLAELGQRKLKRHEYDDAATLQPLYLRPSPGEDNLSDGEDSHLKPIEPVSL